MLQRKRTQAVLALLMVALSVLGGVQPAYAQSVEPQFTLSVSAGRPGLVVEVGQGDPCPEAEWYQQLRLTFTDAAGAVTVSSNPAMADSSGNWLSVGQFTIPFKQMPAQGPYLPSVFAAQGAASFKVECIDMMSGAVTQTYAQRSFMVTGPSPSFTLSRAVVQRAETVMIQSQDACPNIAATVHGSIRGAAGVRFDFLPDVDSLTGAWSSNVVIPEKIQHYMYGEIDLPHGTYVVEVYCATSNQWVADANYGMEKLAVGKPSPRYAALGDSFSSGQGTFNYIDTQNSCHRSNDSYVGFVADELALGEPMFAACGGAMTDDFFVANPANANEPSQLSRLSSANELVTLTVGGNDLDFKGVIEKCVKAPGVPGWGCSGRQDINSEIQQRLNALVGQGAAYTNGRPVRKLLDVYRGIRNGAYGARIFVGGYPHLFGTNVQNFTYVESAPSGFACHLPVIASVDYEDAQWLNRKSDELNAVIQQEVQKARDEGIDITYVPPVFGGHGLCDNGYPWINEVVVDANNNPQAESFHPNAEGYWLGYGITFKAQIQN